MSNNNLFLSFDCSTQSFKICILNTNGHILYTDKVIFHTNLSYYQTYNGIYEDGNKITAPVLMWVEAFEILLMRMKKDKFPFNKIVAISGSTQQHTSIYWSNPIILKNLSSKIALKDQIDDMLIIKNTPIWMDSSSKKQCVDFEKAFGCALNVSNITGSRAYERFTGMQIKKIYEETPELYLKTERISLLSSFMTSLLIQDFASIDYSDAAGMNLMNIYTKKWDLRCLNIVAPNLEEKLGTLKASHESAGTIGNYFIEKYGFNKDTIIIYCSGDNPNSLAGLLLEDTAINLGTSDTIFCISSNPIPKEIGHIFPNPVDPFSYMVMICIKNGALVRENIKGNILWEEFNKILNETPIGNNGKIGLYYDYDEISPPHKKGYYCYNEHNNMIDFDKKTEIRALIEGQILSMKYYTDKMGIKINKIIISGGSSINDDFAQLIASVFDSYVYALKNLDSSLLGAAYRAIHGYLCHKSREFIPFTSLFKNDYNKIYIPNNNHNIIYSNMIPRLKLLLENY